MDNNSTPDIAPSWNKRITNNCLFIDDSETGKVILQHNARPGLRPYIHPLRGPDGKTCFTEDSPFHHPWQHGIATGFHGVNDCDFWFDPGQVVGAAIGTIEPGPPRIATTDPTSWFVDAVWRNTDREILLVEKQTWSLAVSADMQYLDLTWRLQAIPEVSIQQAAYGGLFIRMPFRADRGAEVRNSAGDKDDQCEQQPAAWVDTYMPLDGNEAGGGIAVLDHPSNPGHPSRWRVDNQRGINPAPCISGAIKLKAGEAMCHRYRLVLHMGRLPPEQLQIHWSDYSAEDKP